MTRGELIEALMKAEADPSPTNIRRLAFLEEERNELQEQLRVLRERSELAETAHANFADLFTRAPVPYCVLNRKLEVEEANDAAATLFCASSPVLHGARLTRVVSIQEESTFENHVARCIDERLRVHDEVTMVVRGRGQLNVQVVSTPRVRDDGLVSGCRTIFCDVTRIRRASVMSEFLARTDDLFFDRADLDETVKAITDACVPILGDAVFVDMVRGPALRRASLTLDEHHVSTREPLELQAHEPTWHAYVRRVLEANEMIFEPSTAAAFSSAMLAHGFLLVPLVGRYRPLGVLGAIRLSQGAYTVDQFKLAHQVARRASRAIEAALALAG